MMIFGTGTMITSQLLLDTKTKGFDGKETTFDKTIYSSLVMFFGMAFCYPYPLHRHLPFCPEEESTATGFKSHD